MREGDYAHAEQFAEMSVQNDRYNARALVNRGNCLYMKGELESAKMVYLEAVGVEVGRRKLGRCRGICGFNGTR